MWGVIILPGPNFNGSKPPLKLWHEWIIIHPTILWGCNLLIHSLTNICYQTMAQMLRVSACIQARYLSIIVTHNFLITWFLGRVNFIARGGGCITDAVFSLRYSPFWWPNAMSFNKRNNYHYWFYLMFVWLKIPMNKGFTEIPPFVAKSNITEFHGINGTLRLTIFYLATPHFHENNEIFTISL